MICTFALGLWKREYDLLPWFQQSKISHINRPAGEAVVAALFNRMEIALLSTFFTLHSVLKWLHHPPLKNVMLLHAAVSSQDFLHASMFDTRFDVDRYFSSRLTSHAAFANM